MESFLEYLLTHQAQIWRKLLEHLWIVSLSMLAAIGIGVSTGVLLSRARRWAAGVLGLAGVIQTIPSIALLGFMIPLAGIGLVPAVIALFLYALLPIIRNTYLGIAEVADEVKDAGLGMGMTNWQLLIRVELPLALPTIFAGIRTATVINVGVATLSAYIAAGGLGEFIFSGIALNNVDMMLAGAVPAALLAVLLDALLGLIQRHIRQWFRPLVFGLGGAVLLAVGYQLWPSEAMPRFKAGFEHEFVEREDGWPGLRLHYGLDMEVVLLQAGLMYAAAQEGEVDVISGYTTDGRIPAFGLGILEDDLHFFPPYYAAPLVNQQSLERHPGLEAAINLLAGRINDSIMTALNYQADHLQIPPEQVAKDFLEELGLPTATVRKGKPDVLIGTKNFTEQYILGELYTLLIENHTRLDVGLKKGLGGTKICFDAVRMGEIDLYPEYTGTGFLGILQPTDSVRQALIRDREAVYDYVKSAFERRYGLALLPPIGFNNAYALVMRREDMDAMQINSISDLSKARKKK